MYEATKLYNKQPMYAFIIINMILWCLCFYVSEWICFASCSENNIFLLTLWTELIRALQIFDVEIQCKGDAIDSTNWIDFSNWIGKSIWMVRLNWTPANWFGQSECFFTQKKTAFSELLWKSNSDPCNSKFDSISK